MFWTFDYKNIKHASWGQPRSIPKEQISNLESDFSIKVYGGEAIRPGEKVLFSMQGDATLGMGDSVWLISYIRDIYRIKGRRRCRLDISTSEPIAKFYSNFFPKSVGFVPEYITKEQFDSYHHKLPAMYYWKETDQADRSWVDNKSILERLYRLVGIEYDGLPDFGDFTNEEILYPPKSYYERLKIDPKDKYVFFQWHSSGTPKNLPPKSNIKLLRHITTKYEYKVYVIGRLNGLDQLEDIPGVRNLCNKTTAEDVFSLAFNSEFTVGPDSAGVHLAEAYRIPGVAIMSTLPPSYIASKYKIPTFMFGSGFCSHKPCGHATELPLDKCPAGTKNYCAVMEYIDLAMFDQCISQSYANRDRYRQAESVDFYKSQFLPIYLEK